MAKSFYPIIGIQRLQTRFQKMMTKALAGGSKVSVITGFGTHYGIYVHEDLSMNHPRGGQAKYLEQPFRQLLNSGELVRIIKLFLFAGLTKTQALMAAGQRIQREAQAVVPVDTGLLRSTAYTRVE